MSDWSTVALAVGPAAITGALGYFGARLQYRSELDRLREQHTEDHRRHRQAYYHDTLELLESFHQTITAVLHMSHGEFMPWLMSFRAKIVGVQLFGTARTARAAKAAHSAVMQIEPVVREQSNAPFFPKEDLRKTHPELVNRFDAARTDLLNAMRDDVAPD